MFSAQKLKQYAKDMLFPPFSERELVTLAYLIALSVVVAVVSDPSIITPAITEWAQQLTFQSPYSLWDFVGAILGMAKVVGLGLVGLLIIFALYKIALEQRKIPLGIKGGVASLFYTTLSLTSVFVLTQSIRFDATIGMLMSNVVIGFLLLRSMLTNLVTYIYAKLDYEHLLAMRMSDEQMNRTELVVLIVAATTMFLFLIQGHDRLVAVLLSYFYVTLLFDIYRKIFPQSDPAFIKNIKRIKLK